MDIVMKTALIAGLGLIYTCTANAGTRQNALAIMPDDAEVRSFHEEWSFSEALVVGDTVYLSGYVVNLRRGETDLQTAYTRAFQEIGQILGRAGASWDDVVDITTYHTELATQMPAIVAVKRNFVRAPYPAWTAVEVSRLIPDRGITEIKLVARVRPSGATLGQLSSDDGPE